MQSTSLLPKFFFLNKAGTHQAFYATYIVPASIQTNKQKNNTGKPQNQTWATTVARVINSKYLSTLYIQHI